MRFSDDPMSLLNCGESHQAVYDYELGEVICGKCGLVLDEELPEALFEKRHLETEKAVSRWSRRASHKPSLRPVEDSLSMLFVKGEYPISVRRKACELWRDLHHIGVARGYSASDYSRALLYTAQRLCNVPVVWSELTKSPRAKKRILRCHRKIRSVLNIEVPRTNSTDYVNLLASRLGIDEALMELAIRILREAYVARLCGGSSPIGIAAASLYVASLRVGRRLTQKAIAAAAGVSEVTIRHIVGKLECMKSGCA